MDSDEYIVLPGLSSVHYLHKLRLLTKDASEKQFLNQFFYMSVFFLLSVTNL